MSELTDQVREFLAAADISEPAAHPALSGEQPEAEFEAAVYNMIELANRQRHIITQLADGYECAPRVAEILNSSRFARSNTPEVAKAEGASAATFTHLLLDLIGLAAARRSAIEIVAADYQDPSAVSKIFTTFPIPEPDTPGLQGPLRAAMDAETAALLEICEQRSRETAG